MEGNLTGQDYVEQATYHEWLNSAFADDGDTPKDCQDCHMPLVDGGVIIASGQASLGHAPYGSTFWWGQRPNVGDHARQHRAARVGRKEAH